MTTNVSSANMMLSKQETNPIYNSVTVSNAMRVGEDLQENQEKENPSDSESDGKQQAG